MFEFLKTQWVIRKIDEIYLQARVIKKQITQEQYVTIIATPQISIN